MRGAPAWKRILGSETTRGFSRKRSSLSASGTTKTSDCKIAVEQKAMSREVSEALMPTRDLNHWRSSSTREMRAMGVLQANDARSVRSSKGCSGSVSRMAYLSRATMRASSFAGLALTMSDPPGRSLGLEDGWGESYSKSANMAHQMSSCQVGPGKGQKL